MIDPDDFIVLAIKLSKGRHEADLRSAVSRAYYGAFHSARQLVEECGVKISRRHLYAADIHRKVRFCLDHSGNSLAIKAAEKLDSLRGRRNEADYDLSSADFTPPRVALQLRASQEIIDALRNCRAEPAFSQLGAEIREYARDVLRLQVEEPKG
ncbi:MAG TPA: hypothetical protein VF306_16630 [Pirellulales bacterium]